MGDRPAIYVHFEMGLSWPKHITKDRHITYISKSMRDRANQFPRQLPPPNTNFLAVPQYQVAYQQVPTLTQQPQTRPQHQLTYHPNNAASNNYRDPASAGPAQNGSYLPYQPQQQQQQQHHIREYYAPAAPAQPRHGHVEEERSSRSMSRGSHERGKSAPPPFNSSPWDVANNAQGEPSTWKALPTTPNKYRLGEDDMPWDTWNFPMGYNDEAGDDNERDESRSRPREASLRATWGPEYPPESSRRFDTDDRAKGAARDIQSLATALMTVDNGFEDQWWYQGPRLVNIHGTVLVPTAVPKSSFHPDHQQGSVGWALSEDEQVQQREYQQQWQRYQQEQQRQQTQRHPESFQPSTASFQAVSPRSSSVGDIVSPLSDYPSPLSSFGGGLRRSLTTRSDELHM